jgi:hypothetical protein
VPKRLLRLSAAFVAGARHISPRIPEFPENRARAAHSASYAFDASVAFAMKVAYAAHDTPFSPLPDKDWR